MSVLLAILWKDLVTEWRSRDRITAMLLFSLLVVMVFHFSLPGGATRQTQASAPGVLWIAYVFAALLGLNRSFSQELENDALVRHVYRTKFLGWLFMALSLLLKPASPALADLPYEVEFSVLGDSDLLETLKDASLLRAEENRPPPTESALRRRVDRDAEQLRNVIRSEGYYDAHLDAEIDLDAIPVQHFDGRSL